MPRVTKPGLRFVNNEIIFCREQYEADADIPEDRRTMILIQAVANSIDPDIKVTFDVPSNYEDKMVPILDLKVTVNKQGQVIYKFYQKPMCNRLVTMKMPAMSAQQKFNILTQQCFRWLHNTSDRFDLEVKTRLLSDFMLDLKNSGYDEKDVM